MPAPLTLRQDVAYRRRRVERDLHISTMSYGSPLDLVVGTSVDDIAVLLAILGAVATKASNLRRHFSDNRAARSRNELRTDLTEMIREQLPHLQRADQDPGFHQMVETLLKIEQVEVVRELPAGMQPPALPSGSA